MEQLEPLLDVMRKIAEAHDVPVSAVALGWVMAKGAVPLGGARNKGQAEQVSRRGTYAPFVAMYSDKMGAGLQNAKALHLEMTEKEIAELDANALEGKTSLWQQG